MFLVLCNTIVNSSSFKTFNFTRDLLSSFLSGSGKRDYYKQFDYPNTKDIHPEAIYSLYKRDPFANRIVKFYPDKIWGSPPNILEISADTAKYGITDFYNKKVAKNKLKQKIFNKKVKNKKYFNAQEVSEFEASFGKISKDLCLWKRLRSVDRLARLGRYAVLMIGFEGENIDSLKQPPRTGSRVKYITPFRETAAVIQTWDSDINSERYGYPLYYRITPEFEIDGQKVSHVSRLVHHSRIIHVPAEDHDENNIFGMPCLLPIWNTLIDLKKVVGGSSETYWQNVAGLISMNIDSDFEPDIEEKKSFIEQLDAIKHNIQKTFFGSGATITHHTLPIPDPSPQFKILIGTLAGQTSIPQRSIIGTERGELASSQDKENTNERARDRQIAYCEPTILRPLIDRFIQFRVLPDVEYQVDWKDFHVPTQKEKAETLSATATAIREWVNAGGMPEKAYELLGIPYEEEMFDDALDEEIEESNEDLESE